VPGEEVNSTTPFTSRTVKWLVGHHNALVVAVKLFAQLDAVA
jgi:hypothetical protein